MKNIKQHWIIFLLSAALGLAACATEDTPPAQEVTDDPALVGTLPEQSRGSADTAMLAPGVYKSGVPTQRFEASANPDEAGRQRQSLWCWAASSQMVLNFHGIPVTQEDVVLRAYGDLINQPASSTADIAQAIEGWEVTDQLGRPRRIATAPFEQMRVTDLLTDLHYNQPVVLALENDPGPGAHAYVLSAITYQLDAQGQVYPISVDLRDPWPDNPGHTTLAWDKVLTRFIGYVRIRVL